MAVLEVEASGFEWIVLAMVAARRKGFIAHEVPVTFVNRKEGTSKLRLRHMVRWAHLVIHAVIQKKQLQLDASRHAIAKDGVIKAG